MAALCCSSGEVRAFLWKGTGLELDTGTSPWRNWSRLLRAAGVTPTPALIERIEREDALGWTRVNQRVVDWSRELRAAGYRTAILSNMPPNKLAFMRESGRFDWIDEFEVALFSCDVSLVKPEPGTTSCAWKESAGSPPSASFSTTFPPMSPPRPPWASTPSSSAPPRRPPRSCTSAGACR